MNYPHQSTNVFQRAAVERKKRYQELSNRIKREKQLTIIMEKMQMKKNLRGKKVRKQLMHFYSVLIGSVVFFSENC